MKNIDLVLEELTELRRQYASGNEMFWQTETGMGLVEYIDCPYTSNDCLNAQRDVTDTRSYEWADNCDECKGRWLMNETEMW